MLTSLFQILYFILSSIFSIIHLIFPPFHLVTYFPSLSSIRLKTPNLIYDNNPTTIAHTVEPTSDRGTRGFGAANKNSRTPAAPPQPSRIAYDTVVESVPLRSSGCT